MTIGRRLQAGLLAAALFVLPLACWASAQVENLLTQADAIRTSDPKKFMSLVDQLDKLSAEATPEQLQHLRYLDAYRLALGGKFEAAISDLAKLFGEVKDANLRIRVGSFLAINYAATRQFPEALAVITDTLASVPESQDSEVRHQGILTAAIVYNEAGQYGLARRYAEQVLADQADPRTQCYANSSRAEAVFNLQAMEPDDSDFEAAIRQCEAQGETIAAQFVRGYLARKWHARGDTQKAIALLETSLASVKATHYPRLIGEIESLLAEWHWQQGDARSAEADAVVVVSQAGDTPFTLPAVTAFHVLYEIALSRGDNVKALEYFRRYAETDKAHLNDVKARELAYQMVRQETQQKTQTIELLNRQNKVLQLEQQVSRQRAKNTLLLAALLTVLLASIAYWAYKIKRVQMSFRKLAETDALTGISNRHHFTRQAEEALDYYAKTGEEVGFIMFDLDNFKAINDQYGHGIGDWVLKRVAETCRDVCRKNDRIGRLGGEEFAILLIGGNLTVAERMAQICCERVAAIATDETGHRFQITASFGVSAASLANYGFTRLLAQADQMLYLSKREGRNRVSVHAGAKKPAPAGTPHQPGDLPV